VVGVGVVCAVEGARKHGGGEARARNLGPLVLDGEDVFRPHVPRLLVVKHHLVHRIACALSYTCMLGCLAACGKASCVVQVAHLCHMPGALEHTLSRPSGITETSSPFALCTCTPTAGSAQPH
jgi:hypothetical protein